VNAKRPNRFRGSETGVALLISIFVLLLICVVAIALIVASGTESALAGNYRSATSVYYAALAGLEEGRGRLLARNPDYFLNTNANFVPHSGLPMPVNYVSYVINPVGGETVAPWDTLTSTTYPDKEYSNEFASNPPTVAPQLQWTNSVSAVAGIQGPLYKWVRINPVTEVALKLDLKGDNNPDNTTTVYYDGAHLNLIGNGVQVLEITSLAVLPNGTQKILQYLVASNLVPLPTFPAAVTLVGTNVDYTGPDSSTWVVNGNDTVRSVSPPGCPSSPAPSVYAIGYSNNADSSFGNGSYANIHSGGFVNAYKNNYIGLGSSTSNLGYIGAFLPSNLLLPSGPANLQIPSGLDALAQNITKNADVVVTGPADRSNMPVAMSPTNLMTVVVNGDLDFSQGQSTSSWNKQGYGLLLVTGNLNYDPDISWYGIVLVIGQGTITGSRSGSGEFDGAIFVAKTRDASGNLYPDPNLPPPVGSPPGTYGSSIELPSKSGGSMGGDGVYYSSCWVNAARPSGNYQTLSFHEISQ
jgi:hypothetical protein